MAKKTYPNTPEEEAAAINAKSGDPNGITAEQVASNRALNESLTNALGFGEGGSGFSLSENPFAKLVSGITSQVQAVASQAPELPAEASIDKAKLDETVQRLSGGVGSGLNGATGNAEGMGEWDGDFTDEDWGDASYLAAGNPVDTSLGGISGSLSTLSADASALAAKFPGGSEITSALSKITGGDLAGGIKSLASGISKGAGALNDILSLKRGANLPNGAELFQQTGQEVKLTTGDKADWRVRIKAQWEYFDSPLFKLLENTGGVVFPITPTVSFDSSANYSAIDTIHSNYPFLSYKNSQVSDISISGQFPADTETDAAYWIAATTFLRTATKMFYGTGEHAGNPPMVVWLSGYGASMFDNVPCVVKSFNLELPSDVNYVKCDAFGTSTWVPIMSSLSVTLAPIYNRANLRKFNLKDFASGKMTNGSGVGYL